jgi:hypothetical protein
MPMEIGPSKTGGQVNDTNSNRNEDR